MCDKCRENKTELMEEIRLLAAGEGEEYEQFVEVISLAAEEANWKDNEGNPVDVEIIRREMTDVWVAQAIALRAAFIASYCDYLTEEGKCPPSMVLGMWAGNAMQIEARKSQFDSVLSEIFGGISNN